MTLEIASKFFGTLHVLLLGVAVVRGAAQGDGPAVLTGRLSASEDVEQAVRGVVAEEEPVGPRRLDSAFRAPREQRFHVLGDCALDVAWVRSDGLA